MSDKKEETFREWVVKETRKAIREEIQNPDYPTLTTIHLHVHATADEALKLIQASKDTATEIERAVVDKMALHSEEPTKKWPPPPPAAAPAGRIKSF